jgi:hypothetical protein
MVDGIPFTKEEDLSDHLKRFFEDETKKLMKKYKIEFNEKEKESLEGIKS